MKVRARAPGLPERGSHQRKHRFIESCARDEEEEEVVVDMRRREG